MQSESAWIYFVSNQAEFLCLSFSSLFFFEEVQEKALDSIVCHGLNADAQLHTARSKRYTEVVAGWDLLKD